MTHQLPDELREQLHGLSQICGDCEHPRCIGKIEQLERAIATHTAKAVEDTAKAYGNCTDCYGKGYATRQAFINGKHKYPQDPMVFCKCDRGKQLKAQLGEAVEAARVEGRQVENELWTRAVGLLTNSIDSLRKAERSNDDDVRLSALNDLVRAYTNLAQLTGGHNDLG